MEDWSCLSEEWFIANLAGTGFRDKVTDLSASEFANDLTFIFVWSVRRTRYSP
jgi:hypothetical protein